ncbi:MULTISPECIES: acyl-[acyl-carrier-protein] thioesterase [unclassified Mesotoga]|uniref:acyl-[acyl-carrier-protein] thioesterase n=1 Tax=unclassified Mesotoga TaxID=1184398 RepID=UPI00211E20D5|nr:MULTISPECIES: acyl-ACP thioesterase domain-containing protein [unclassified Mesotoga]
MITKEVYRVRYYELDCQWKASISSLMDYFNDVVTLQTVEMGHGVDIMSKGEYAWLLLRWDVKVNRYPDYLENVVVQTIPYSMDRFYAYRRFEIFDCSGNVIVDANSQWILIDQRKRRPIRIGDQFYELYGIDSDFHEPLSFPKVNENESSGEEITFIVSNSDLDTNGHSNNVAYVRWIMETVPSEFVKRFLRRLTIEYKRESRKGDVISVESVFENGADFAEGKHKIISSGRVLSLARTEWK